MRICSYCIHYHQFMVKYCIQIWNWPKRMVCLPARLHLFASPKFVELCCSLQVLTKYQGRACPGGPKGIPGGSKQVP